MERKAAAEYALAAAYPRGGGDAYNGAGSGVNVVRHGAAETGWPWSWDL